MATQNKKNKNVFAKKTVMRRYFIIFAVFVLLGLAIVGRIGYLAFVEANYWKAVSERFVKQNIPLMPQRGNILSANGEVLATSLPQYKMYMDFMDWETDPARHQRNQLHRDSLLFSAKYAKDLDSLCNGMHRLFPDIDPVAFKKHLREGRKKESHNWLLYPKRISYIQLREVKRLPIFCLSGNAGGFHTTEYLTRENPYGKLAARTVGDLYGEKDEARCGIELYCDSILRGKPGFFHRQKVLNRYLPIVDKPQENGLDIRTTIDIQMQDICEKALGDQIKELGAAYGVCVLMEVATGNVKAMTSLDLCSDGEVRELQNRAVSQLMEPGSVFKSVSFMVGLDEGAFTMNTPVNTGCGIKEMHGRKMKDSHWHRGGDGVITAEQVLMKSSNVGTSTLIDDYYFPQNRTKACEGAQKYVDAIYATGIADDLHLPLPGYAKPKIPSPKTRGEYWSKTDMAWMSIGYVTQVPPISTCAFYNGIANNGRMMQPRLLDAKMKDGQVVEEYPYVAVREKMCKESTVKALQVGLRKVVVAGTGKAVASKLVHIAGKTGTAQIWTKGGNTNQYLISMVGFFPYENPQYTCIVCLKKSSPAYGGPHCGPVLKRVAETVMALKRQTDFTPSRDTLNSLYPSIYPGNLHSLNSVLSRLKFEHSGISAEDLSWGNVMSQGKTYQLKSDQVAPNTMPNVHGYGIRDAVFRLEKMGLKVKAIGKGHVVRQSIAPGEVVKKGQRVEILLSTDGKIPVIEVPDSLAILRRDSLRRDSLRRDSIRKDTTQKEVKKVEPASENITHTTHT